MRRAFPILVAVVGSLLMAGFAAGLLGPGGDLRRVVRLAGASAALAVHATVFVYLVASGRRVRALAGSAGMPVWVGALAAKNRRKALAFEVPGSLLAIVGIGLVLGEWGHPIVLGSSVSFQVGSFLGEALIVANQSRLLDELAASPGRADRAPGLEPPV